MASTTEATSQRGSNIQPTRRPGAGVLLTEARYTTRSGIESGDRPERESVVAEIGVVVVLYHDAAPPLCPREQRGATGSGQGHACLELVGWVTSAAALLRSGTRAPSASPAKLSTCSPSPAATSGSLGQPGPRPAWW